MAKATTKRTSTPTKTASEDALTLLKHDHEEVKKLFSQFEKARAETKQHEVGQAICMELTIHAEIEEQSFYPEVRRHEGMLDMVLESLEEHRQVKELVAKLKDMEASNSRYEPDMKVLKEDVEHHVQEEEKEMFPKVEKVMPKARLEQLGQIMKQQKTTMKSRMESEAGMAAERRVQEDVREATPGRMR